MVFQVSIDSFLNTNSSTFTAPLLFCKAFGWDGEKLLQN